MYVLIGRCTIMARQDGSVRYKAAQCYCISDGWIPVYTEYHKDYSGISIGLENPSHPCIATRGSTNAMRITNDDRASEPHIVLFRCNSTSTLSGIQKVRHAE